MRCSKAIETDSYKARQSFNDNVAHTYVPNLLLRKNDAGNNHVPALVDYHGNMVRHRLVHHRTYLR